MGKPFRMEISYRKKNWRRRASEWEQDKARLFWTYLGDDKDEAPRMRLLSKRLHAKKRRAHMPARHIHAPSNGLIKRIKPRPLFLTLRELRGYIRVLRRRPMDAPRRGQTPQV